MLLKKNAAHKIEGENVIFIWFFYLKRDFILFFIKVL
jgi:hypothetical protein